MEWETATQCEGEVKRHISGRDSKLAIWSVSFPQQSDSCCTVVELSYNAMEWTTDGITPTQVVLSKQSEVGVNNHTLAPYCCLCHEQHRTEGQTVDGNDAMHQIGFWNTLSLLSVLAGLTGLWKKPNDDKSVAIVHGIGSGMSFPDLTTASPKIFTMVANFLLCF